MPIARAEAWRLLVLAAVAVGVLFVGLGNVPLFDKDEGAFAEATREMVSSGNYLMTYLDGEPRYDKPILIYWFQALSVHLFGVNEFAVRLPSSVASLAWVAALYVFTRWKRGPQEAFWATFLLLTAIETNLVMKAAIADALLNACIAASMFLGYWFHESGRRGPLYAASLAMGLGFLTKGPIAILIPLGTAVLFCLSTRSWAWLGAGLRRPWAWIIFFGVLCTWYPWAILDQGQPILDAWIFKHTLGRFHAPMEGHGGGFLYYIPVLLIGLMPYTSLLVVAFWDACAPLRRGIRRLLTRAKEAGDAAANGFEPLDRFLLIWFALVFTLFSFSGTKLPHYLVYGLTPVFIFMARRVERLPGKRALLVPGAIMLLLLLGLPFALEPASPLVNDSFAKAVMHSARDEFGLHYYLFCGAAFVLVAICAFVRSIPPKASLAIAGLAVVLTVNFAVMPVVGCVLQGPVKEAAALALREGYEVKPYHVQNPSFVFYRGTLSPKGDPVPGDIVFTKVPRLEKLGSHEILFQKYGLALARLTSP